MRHPIFPAPRPWHAEPMDIDQPNGGWQVRSSPIRLEPFKSDGVVIAVYLSKQDAEDIAAGVNKVEAERRIDAESDIDLATS